MDFVPTNHKSPIENVGSRKGNMKSQETLGRKGHVHKKGKNSKSINETREPSRQEDLLAVGYAREGGVLPKEAPCTNTREIRSIVTAEVDYIALSGQHTWCQLVVNGKHTFPSGQCPPMLPRNMCFKKNHLHSLIMHSMISLNFFLI